jgi:hypothetical protein
MLYRNPLIGDFRGLVSGIRPDLKGEMLGSLALCLFSFDTLRLIGVFICFLPKPSSNCPVLLHVRYIALLV